MQDIKDFYFCACSGHRRNASHNEAQVFKIYGICCKETDHTKILALVQSWQKAERIDQYVRIKQGKHKKFQSMAGCRN